MVYLFFSMIGELKLVEYKSATEELWLVRHPLWVRILEWVGLPFVTLAGFYVLAIPLWTSTFELVVIASCLFLGGFPIYMCYQSFKVFRFIGADIEVNEQGFAVYWPGGESRRYSWMQVGKLNHYTTAQVLEVVSKQGDRILAIFQQASSYNKFVELAVANTGCKY